MQITNRAGNKQQKSGARSGDATIPRTTQPAREVSARQTSLDRWYTLLQACGGFGWPFPSSSATLMVKGAANTKPTTAAKVEDFRSDLAATDGKVLPLTLAGVLSIVLVWEQLRNGHFDGETARLKTEIYLAEAGGASHDRVVTLLNESAVRLEQRCTDYYWEGGAVLIFGFIVLAYAVGAEIRALLASKRLLSKDMSEPR